MAVATRLLSFTSLLLLLLSGSVAHGQISYSGRIGDSPVRMVMERPEHGDKLDAIYLYTEYDKPISLRGMTQDSVVVLHEKDEDGDTRARLMLSGFQEDPDTITGTWESTRSEKVLKVKLHRNFSLGYEEGIEWKERRYILQDATLGDWYFMLGVAKEEGRSLIRTREVKIYEQKSDSLIQAVDVDGELIGLNSVRVKDYNFDGHEDFSVFEKSYAGPNVTRVYFLYNPENGTFRRKNLPGTSLSFFPEKELFQSRNQSQAGCMITVSKYTFRGMEVELLEESCYVCNDEGERVERKMKACE